MSIGKGELDHSASGSTWPTSIGSCGTGITDGASNVVIVEHSRRIGAQAVWIIERTAGSSRRAAGGDTPESEAAVAHGMFVRYG
ncbi:hypothetical protein [Agrococcus lahaulensis]|uniref:hypothetical protein n=1 Tax=Agrococcus lahaulensis TaxID=341722 RepID=UPI00041A8E1C|nr:hypothetical protein [Agrococcus lahaulensis]